MYIPSSTYRVQLHKDFTFGKLYGIIDYLDALGVTTIYASPIFAATPGSMHGYDVIDPHRINPEIGTIDEFRRLRKRLREKNMGWIQDIVPNHMAFSVGNYRLMDVLERGPHSPYYRYFDIDWAHPSAHLHGKVQVPILGGTLGDCVRRGEISLVFSERGFGVAYFDNVFPLSLSAIAALFEPAPDTAFSLPDLVSMGASTPDYADWTSDKEAYLSAVLNDDHRRIGIDAALAGINADYQRLEHVLDQLYYVLCHWTDTGREINYRRFFTVNELICLRMEDEEVFDEYHRLIAALYREGLIDGLRIDHIDGLLDPGSYIDRLRRLCGPDCYIIAEKILERNEHVPETWSLQGTSGYEFLSCTSQLITNRKGVDELVAFYRALVPELPSYEGIVTSNKKMILEQYMAGEWKNLATRLAAMPAMEEFNSDRLKQALGLLMIAFPVYRVYPAGVPLQGEAAERMKEAHARALRLNRDLQRELDAIVGTLLEPDANDAAHDNRLAFARRLMQFTGPLTAKGVEDTTFYVYNALISHDEVGDTPSQQGISIENFHSRMIRRLRDASLSLNTTATHDTKRGEDARLRLNLLAEYTGEWKRLVTRWFEGNAPLRRLQNGNPAPSVNDEYYIYQAITGGFPEDFTVTDAWTERLVAYEIKVLREAKVHTNWTEPNDTYEEACINFIRAILDESAFMESFMPFIRALAAASHRYINSQVLLKVTAPGIPDIYQGCELWDLSFVDPDNRRPVDYSSRSDILEEIREVEKQGWPALRAFLGRHEAAGYGKLFITWKALDFRRANPGLFERGAYLPVTVRGDRAVVVAFFRRLAHDWVLVVVPLRVADDASPFAGCRLELPEGAPAVWRNVFTGEAVRMETPAALDQIVGGFSVALLASPRQQ